MKIDRPKFRRKGRPTLIEQSHNARKAFIRAKNRGDKAEAARLAEFIEWVNNRIQDNLKKGKK